MPGKRSFKMGSLDHIHIRVPNREEAARWYGEHLGFEPVETYEFWSSGFEGGPLQISADGGRTMLALFEATNGRPMITQQTGVAFTVDPETFITFARSLPCGINRSSGEPLLVSDLVDFDLCWAFEFSDPWGNLYELNCYDYATVKTQLVDADGVQPDRKWPADLYRGYLDQAKS